MMQTSIVGSESKPDITAAIVLSQTSQELCNLAQLPPFSPDQAAEMVKIRKDLPPDLLAVFTRNLIGHYGKGLYKISRPFLQDVKRNFDNLDRTKQVDGSYREYDGARSFNEWLEKHKNQIGSKRNAYYILAGGVPDNGTPSRAPWSTMTADGTNVLDAFSTIQKDIRRSEKPGDYFEREAIYFTKQLYFIHWPIWKRLLIIASEDVGLADLSVSREVAHLWEVAKTVKDAKHSDLLMLIEAVAICCRAKKSRAIDNAVHYDKTWTPMTDEEAEKMVSGTTAYNVPDYADDGLHTASNGGAHETFVVKEDAALGNRSDVGEIVSADYKRGYDEGFAAGVASVTPATKSKPSKKTREPKRSKSAAGQVHVDELPPEARAKVMSQIEAASAQTQPTTQNQPTAAPAPEPPQQKDWSHRRLLSKQESDDLLLALEPLPWIDEIPGKSYVNYGRAYFRGGKIGPETPDIPEMLLPLAKRVAEIAQVPINYIQCHRYEPESVVLPHVDPGQVIVPMLSVGQERTFRVGGKMSDSMLPQRQRKLKNHYFEESVLMKHGDLLVFTGGKVAHSMVLAKDDPAFNPNGFQTRYTLLFRWTTEAMRKHGPGNDARKAGHDKQYKKAVSDYRSGFTDFLGRPKS